MKFIQKIKEKLFGQKCIECGEVWYPYSGVKMDKFVCPECLMKK